VSGTAPDATRHTGREPARGRSGNSAPRTPRPRGNSPRGHADKPACNKDPHNRHRWTPFLCYSPRSGPTFSPWVQTCYTPGSCPAGRPLGALGQPAAAGRRRKSSVLCATADHYRRDLFQYRRLRAHPAVRRASDDQGSAIRTVRRARIVMHDRWRSGRLGRPYGEVPAVRRPFSVRPPAEPGWPVSRHRALQ
jgi:hypothetical protein